MFPWPAGFIWPIGSAAAAVLAHPLLPNAQPAIGDQNESPHGMLPVSNCRRFGASRRLRQDAYFRTLDEQGVTPQRERYPVFFRTANVNERAGNHRAADLQN